MRQNSKHFIASALTFALCVCTALSGSTFTEAKAKKVKKVTITSPVLSKVYLKQGESFKLKTKVTPTKAKNKKLNFQSSKSKVASVSSKGKITAKKVGTTKITAIAKDGSRKKATITVQVLKKFKKAKSVALNQKKVTLYINGEASEKTFALKAAVKPAKATVKNVVYQSSNKNIITVSKKGKITAKREGSAKVTAYAADGRGAKTICQVTVTQKKSGSTTPDLTPTPTAPANNGPQKLRFQAVNNFMSYAVVRYTLPAGVRISDLTTISFEADSKQDASIRFYAGENRADDEELTSVKQEVKDTVTGTGTAVVENTTVKKTTHKLEIQTTQSTRPVLKAGSKQTVSFDLDAAAKERLQGSQENEVQFTIYPHAIKPEMSFYSLKLKTATATYEVPLNNDMWKARFGGFFTLV